MAKLIRSYDNANAPIVSEESDTLDLIYFNLVSIEAGERHTYTLPAHESLVVVMQGTVDVETEGLRFEGVGRRKDIWSGNADSVYVPLGATATVTARTKTQLAIAGGRTDQRLSAFRVTPEEVDMVDVGSVETHTHRQIFHILGQRQTDQVGRLLVSELYADPGCWSGYPPHKHDTEDGDRETDHEELYHYRFLPDAGFGGQGIYNAGETPQSLMTRSGDTFLLDKGYHPTSTSPGHRGYIFTILVGRHRRGLIQSFDPRHDYLMDAFPGIQAMRDKFR
ncbi:5-deoxy-glucuronate isomerase [Rhizobium sp. P38BS-XIX]|uniref:5-deoxy-glucuronate isomerase n=1 Tax=Rhizobium sp. P38BS-XIX TaxID=2726740 RepID=UPI0014576787|nr:5-deoxy-glucuronate isomerase [Rhizobium sp. P38BS-XIX]NLS00802.1 5-deoxy-glucuronate isomerase [Rhizobium sp. P38BS-XIX]